MNTKPSIPEEEIAYRCGCIPITRSAVRHLIFFSICYWTMIICIILGPVQESNWLSMIIGTNIFEYEIMHYSVQHFCVALMFFYGSEVLRYLFLYQLGISDRWWPAACASFVFYLSREIRDKEKLHFWDIPGWSDGFSKFWFDFGWFPFLSQVCLCRVGGLQSYSLFWRLMKPANAQTHFQSWKRDYSPCSN